LHFPSIILYNSDLTAAEIDRDERYLSKKWGVPLGFSPTNIAGLISWLDAADPSTVIDSGSPNFNVSGWNDKSGNGNDVAQLTGANQPTIGIETISGVNALKFDGANDFLFRAIFTGGALTQPNTIFIVC